MEQFCPCITARLSLGGRTENNCERGCDTVKVKVHTTYIHVFISQTHHSLSLKMATRRHF